MTSNQDVELFVARRLQGLRRERGLTLAALAGITGMSAAHLSRLESGDRQPSVAALLQLARAYGVSVSSLVDDQDNRGYQVVRADEAPERTSGDGSYALLTRPHSTLAAVRATLRPGRTSDEARHTGEEWVHVLDGTLTLTLAGEAITLATGDSIHFDSWLVHTLAAKGRRPVTVLIASSSATAPIQHPLPAE